MTSTLASDMLDAVNHSISVVIKGLNDKIRHCYECDKPLYWRDFIIAAERNSELEKFGMGLLKIIWKDDLFILKCCSCFLDLPRPVYNPGHVHAWVYYPGGTIDDYRHFKTCRFCGLSLYSNGEIRNESDTLRRLPRS